MSDNAVDKKMCDDVDAKNNPVEIWYGDTLAGSRVMPLFLKTYAEILEKGHGSSLVSWDGSNKFNVLYCTTSSGDILGGIAFEYRPLVREGWIMLSFTDPAHRGKEINKLLHTYFESMVQQRGGNKICSHVHVDNAQRLKSAAKVGLAPQFYRMYKEI